MTQPFNVCAVDLGAESGRVSLGRFDGSQLHIEVMHRFPNRSMRVAGTLHWDTLALFDEIVQGIRKAVQAAGGPIASVGVDTWGVDFGILDENGALLGIPVHYRDTRTKGLIEEVTAQISKEEIFAQSGIAFWPFNTLYQLRALALQHSPLLREGKTLLFTPDLLHYWLCGTKVSERSIASTSQCLDVNTDEWLTDLLASLDIPAHFLPKVVPAGTILGPLLPDVAAAVGQEAMQVITPASHDTASAVVATPLSSADAAYLSCGTWSLLGVESATPMATPAALAAEFTNEKGIGDTYRVLKNIMGLWLVQQSRAAWARAGQQYEYAELAALAQEGTPFRSWIDPNDLRFYAPADMVTAVQQACADSGQPVPETVADVMRCLLESLAFTYRGAVDQLEELKGISIPCLHVIGGGSQNTTLCQWTANALGRPVIAGPTEGTTMGNLLVQLMALGKVRDLAEIRQIVRQSTDLITYEPVADDAWQSAYAEYRQRLAAMANAR
ncbi:MAG TPA: rhamnulokinase family protein [Armatimonadota bacterium]|jgi:rhamnulokinase